MDISHLDNEVLVLIHQYLTGEGFQQTCNVMQEEASMNISTTKLTHSQIKKIKTAVLQGDWVLVEQLCLKHPFKNHKSFLYLIYKQGYLELLEKQEYQKAFTYLTKLLKPLESRQTFPDDFRDLCYLITCKSVQDAPPSFRFWDGGKEGRSREKLAEQFESLLEFDSTGAIAVVPPNRLMELIRQATLYQLEIEHSNTYNNKKGVLNSLLNDYQSIKIPNVKKNTLVGHKDNVKCVTFIKDNNNNNNNSDDVRIVSGSSDNTIKIWSITKGNKMINNIEGQSRIWDIDSIYSERLKCSLIASASGDSYIKLFSLDSSNNIIDTNDDTITQLNNSNNNNNNNNNEYDNNVKCIHTLKGHTGDVYTVEFHPNENYIVSGGYDKTICLFDIRTGIVKKQFVGHQSSISKAINNKSGNLIISGSKDSTIKIWDIFSGVCIKTLTSHLGEITSLQLNSTGNLLLSGAKDNSNRLFDLRMARPVRKFRGHQNTSKNYVRCCFGEQEQYIIGGSEDASIYCWDITSGNVIQKLTGHSGIVYNVTWSPKLPNTLVSCSHDNTIATWIYKP